MISNREEVVRLATAGHPPRAIERRTGLSRGSIYAYISGARARGVEIPRFSTAGIAAVDGTRMVLPMALTEVLRPHAARRGLSTAALARALLAETVRSGLVDAVLDDGGDADD